MVGEEGTDPAAEPPRGLRGREGSGGGARAAAPGAGGALTCSRKQAPSSLRWGRALLNLCSRACTNAFWHR